MAVIYACPTDKRLLCPWEGNAGDIKQHFEKEHNGLLFRSSSVEIDLNILHENKLLDLQDEIYLIQSHIQNNKLCLRLRYLGDASRASKKTYDVSITANNVFYKWETGRNFVLPVADGWEIDLEALESHQGKLHSLICNVVITNFFDEPDATEIKRKMSSVELNISNKFIETNVCDVVENNIYDDINTVNEKLEALKNNRLSADSDLMDNISYLNLKIIEEPFQGMDDTKSLLGISEESTSSCQNCNTDMLPPIYLCVNGHNICAFCRNSRCKECNGNVTEHRNTELENFSRNSKHPCKYANDGCNEKLYYTDLRAHEVHCSFVKYKCQSEDCVIEEKFYHFINHLKVVHSSIKITQHMNNEFPKNSEFYITNNRNGIFYCKSEQIADFINWKTTFCGPKERQFFCEITFKGAKTKDPLFLKRNDSGTYYEIQKTLGELKKMKVKEKHAVLSISCYDN